MSSGTYRPDLHTREWTRIRLQVLERDGWTCQVHRGGGVCGRRLGKYATVDHIIPHALGGATTLDNLRAACYRCNSSRGARQRRGHQYQLPKARVSRFG